MPRALVIPAITDRWMRHAFQYTTDAAEVPEMAITRIYLDDDALRRAMAISGVHTEQDAVNLALRFFSAHAAAEDFDHPFPTRTAS